MSVLALDKKLYENTCIMTNDLVRFAYIDSSVLNRKKFSVLVFKSLSIKRRELEVAEWQTR